jgi:hypothetical protein
MMAALVKLQILMKNNLLTILLTILVILILIIVGIAIFKTKDTAPTQNIDRLKTYTANQNKFSFKYPSNYYLKEHETGTVAKPQHSIVLAEDTAENRDLLDGKSTIPREGPISITINVYSNPNKLASADWIKEDTNWTIRTSELTPLTVGAEAGVTYSWSGLYEGRSTVVTRGDLAYVFSVTWLSPTDNIITDYDLLLSTVEFAN